MRELNPREKRTIRLAAIGLGGYLLVFYGLKAWTALEARRAAYAAVALEAQALTVQGLREQTKRKRLRTLRAAWKIDFPRLAEKTVVGDARVALERTARAAGVGVGFPRERPGRRRAGELAVFQVSGGGRAEGFVRFIHALRTFGYPLVIDSIQVKAGKKPGTVTFSFVAALLGYEGGSGKAARRA